MMANLTLYKVLLVTSMLLANLVFINAQTPIADVGASAENFVGESFCFDIEISNDDSNVGFQPYFQVIIPPELDFESIEFGSSAGTIVLQETFDATGIIEDPLISMPVMGIMDSKLIIFQLPIGSIVQGGPMLSTELCLGIDLEATIGTPLPVTITPIFGFGDTATNTNGPIVGMPVTKTISPILAFFDKDLADMGNDQPPGPSYPLTYTLTLDIANQQTINAISFSDVLPSNLQFVGVASINGGTGCTLTSSPSTSNPGGLIAGTCTNATGTIAPDEILIEYQAYIIDVLDQSNCAVQDIVNTANNGYNGTAIVNTDEEETDARHMTSQKSMSPLINVPGDVVTTTINFQVSDYSELDELVITDISPNGFGAPSNFNLIIGGSNISVTPTVVVDMPFQYQHEITLDVIAANSGNLDGPITGSFSYQSIILETFDGNMGTAVLANDNIGESALLEWSTVQNTGSCTNVEGAAVRIEDVSITKTLLAPTGSTNFVPGTTLTYRLEMDIPSGDVKDLVFEDFFPLPVLNISDFDPVWGSNVRLVTGNGYVNTSEPTMIKNLATNSFMIEWPFIVTSGSTKIGVDIDVVISDDPFADGLFHTNLLQATTNNSALASTTDLSLNQIQVFAPEMELEKRIIASNNATSNIDGDGNISGVNAGDIISFEVVANNIGGAGAYDFTLLDTPPSEFGACNIVSVTSSNGNSYNYTGDLFQGGIQLNSAVLSGDLVSVKYNCTCLVESEIYSTVTNTATGTYASLPNAPSYPPLTDDAETTFGTPSISKEINDISPNITGVSNKVQIGDTLTYKVVVVVPEGTSVNTKLLDNLSSGLTYIDIVSLTASSELSTSITGGFAAIENTNITGTNFNISFGTVINSNTNNAQEETITIFYRVLVANASINNHLRNLKNRARWSTGGIVITSNRPNVQVWDSQIAITKGIVDSDNLEAQAFIVAGNPPNSNIEQSLAGDEVTFQITVVNSRPGKALGVVISDPTVDGLTACSLTNVINQNGDILSHTGSLFTAAGLQMDELLGNSQAIVTYVCTIEPDVNPGQIITNTGTVTWDPSPGETTQNELSDDASIEIQKATVEKSIIDVQPGYGASQGDVTIGEMLTYEAKITLPQGVSNLVSFIDELDEGLAFIQIDTVIASIGISSSTAASFDLYNLPSNYSISNIGGGTHNLDRRLAIDFGTVTNSDTNSTTPESIIVRYKVRVLNYINNVEGTVLNNVAQWEYDDPNDPGTPTQVIGTTSVTVREAAISMTKAFSQNTIENDEETFVTLTISHEGISGADANDLVITDVLPFGINYLENSIGSSCADAVFNIINDPTPNTGGTVEVSLSSLPINSSCSVSFRVEYDPASDECMDLVNCATVEWESLLNVDQGTLLSPPNNTLGFERTGNAADPGFNPYTTQGCDTMIITNGLAIDPFITVNNPVCEGDLVLFENVSTYSGQVVTHNWYGPNGLITGNSNFQLTFDPITSTEEGEYYVITVVDGCPSDTSNFVNLVINEKPDPLSVTYGGPYCEGENISLFATGAQAGNNSFEWSGPNAYSSTAQNPIIPNADLINAGSYTVVVTNEDGCVSAPSLPVIVDINTAPDALTIVNDGPACADGFSVVSFTASNITSGGIISWYNELGVLQATGNPFVLNSLMTEDAGNYYAIIAKDGCASPISNISTLVLDEPTSEIAFAGNDQTLCEGTTNITLEATMPSSAQGTWAQAPSNPTGANIVNPHNPNTAITGLVIGEYEFTWNIGNGTCGIASSDEVTIIITDNIASPIASNDGPQCAGGSVTLLATSNVANAIYEWTGPNGFSSNIQSPILSDVTQADAGDYKVKVITQDGCESDYSVATNLIINEGLNQPLLFLTSGNVCDGDPIELTISASGAASYEWYGPDGGNPSFTTNSNILSIQNTSSAYVPGDWRVKAIAAAGCESELSDPVAVAIGSIPMAPSVTTNPIVCENSDLVLLTSTIPNASYSWTGPNSFVSNLQSPTLFDLSADDNGIYNVQAIVNGCTSVETSIAVIANLRPTASPTNNGGACGSTLNLFTNPSTGSGNYSYSWSGPNGFISNDENPSIASPSMINEGSYAVVVSDLNTGCISNAYTTQVDIITGSIIQPTISGETNVCRNDNITLSTLDFAGSTVTYEWTGPNGLSTSNGDYPNAANISLNNIQLSQSGIYIVTVTVDGCSSNSSSDFELIVNENPNINISSDLLSLCADGMSDITLMVNPTNGLLPYGFQWTGPNNFSSNQENPLLINASSIDNGTYNAIVTDGNGCESSEGFFILDIMDNPEMPIISGSTELCVGDRLELNSMIFQGADVHYFWSRNGVPLNNDANVLVIDPVDINSGGTYTLQVQVDDCISTEASVVVTINPGITATVDFQNLTCVDEATELNLTAMVNGGTPPYNYTWTGPNGFTSDLAAPVLLNLSEANAGIYTLSVTDSKGCSSASSNGLINISVKPESPIFTPITEPCFGEDVQLMIQAYTGPGVTYNWSYNDVSFSHDSPVLFIESAEDMDSGKYEVFVTVNGCNSDIVEWNINVNPSFNVEVLNQRFLCIPNGGEVSIASNVSGGSSPYTYSWIGPNGFSSVNDVPVIPNANTSNSGTYTLELTDSEGCTSEPVSAVITITNNINTPIITSSGNACEGEDITLEVQSYSGSIVSYAWYNGSLLLSENSNVLNVSNVSATNSGAYSVIVTVDGCTATSEVLTIEIYNTPEIEIMTTEPILCTDGLQDITIDATPSNGVAPYIVSWNGPNGYFSGDEDAVITNVTSAAAGTYNAIAIDANGCESNVVSTAIDITDALDQPTITSSGPICVGETITLSIPEYNGSNVNYAWTEEGFPVGNSSNILNLVNLTSAYQYEVTVTVDGCSATSEAFTPIINRVPLISIDAIAPILCTNGLEDVLINSNPSGGSAPFVFTWTGPNGFTSNEEDPYLPNVNGSDVGNYVVILTDANGCASLPVSVTLDVSDGPNQPVIVSTGAACEGENTTLSVNQYLGSAVSYDWKKDNISLGINSTTLVLDPISSADAGAYILEVTVDGCTIASEAFEVVVNENPTVTIDSIAPITCTTGSEDLTLNASVMGGQAPFSYSWVGPNNFNSSLENPTLININESSSGTYILVVTDANDCQAGTASLELSVSEGIAEPVLTSSGVVCENGAILLSITEQYSGTSISYAWSKDNVLLSNTSASLELNPVSLSDIGLYEVTVIVDGCEATSDPLSVNVFENPQLTIDPVAPITCTDGMQDLTLSATISAGTSPFQYAWTGPNGFSSSLATPTVSNISETNAGSYTLTILDENNCSSNSASIEIEISEGLVAPIISSTAPSICAGESFALSVDAYTGSSVLYQWTFEGNVIANSNTNELIINPASTANAGDYSVNVTVDGCTANSALFTQVVNEKPLVSIDPVAAIACADGTDDITINTTITGGLAAYAYSWTGPNGFSSTLENLDFTNVDSSISGTYTLTVTDTNNCVSESVSVVLDIEDGLPEPVITSSGATCEGDEVVLSIPLYAGTNVTYAWSKDGNPIANNSNELMLSPVATTDAGNYQVTVDVNGCIGVSDVYALEVYEKPNVTINALPPFLCVDGSKSLVLSATVTGGLIDYQYAWSGPDAFNSASESPIINNINESNAGTYSLIVTDQNGCVANTASIVVEITEGIDAPIISSTAPSICDGESFTLSIDNYTGNFVEYEWSLGGNVISNSNTNELIIDPASTSDAGDYEVSVIVDGCAATSIAFNQVVNEKPIVTIDPIADIECTNGNEDLSLASNVIGGLAPYAYAWTGPNGFSSTLENPTISNISAANAGTYSLITTDANTCVSNEVSIEISIVEGLTAPVIASNAPNICEGEAFTLSIDAYSGSSVVYEWTLEGNIIANSNTNELIIDPASTADAGDYSVSVTVDGCEATSALFTQTINEKAIVTIDPVPAIACADGTDDIEVNATVTGGLANYIYSWTGPNGFVSSLEDFSFTNVTSSISGTYTLVVFDANTCISEAVSVVLDIEDGIPEPVITSSGATCEGDEITLNVPAYAGNNVTYIWTKNGNPISNNSNMITLNPVSSSDAGAYAVSVDINGCLGVSDVYDLEVYEKPVVSISNIAPIECADGSQDLTLAATVTGGLANYAYAWTGPNGFSSAIENPIINGISEINAGTYNLVVSDANGCIANTASVEVSVTTGINQPIITSNSPVCAGEEVLIEVASYAGSNVIYNWTKDGQPISNNNNQLFISPSSVLNQGIYEVTVNVDGCSSTATPFELVIYEMPSVSIDPIADITCTTGTEILNLNSNVIGGLAPFIYNWTGPNGFTSTIANPTISNIGEVNAGTYNLAITDANICTSVEVSIEVSISEGLSEPSITGNGPMCEGEAILLETAPFAGSNISYIWQKDGLPLANNSHQLILDPVTTSNTGEYRVTIESDGCSSISDIYFLSIYENPEVSINPIEASACTDGEQDIVLSATVANGDGNYQYTWSGPNGFNSSLAEPTIFDATEFDAGTYSLIVSDGNGCSSAMASIEIIISDGIIQPVITGTNAICEDETLALSIQAYAGTAVSYTWTKDGITIPNNSNELVFDNASPTNAGTYEVTVEVNGCTATSAAFEVSVNEKPQIAITPVPAQLCTDGLQSISLEAIISGGSMPFIYEWTGPNAFFSSLANPTISNISAQNAGTYTLIVTDANDCMSETASIEIEITDALEQPIITSSGVTCEGGEIVLEVPTYSGASLLYSWSLNGASLNNNSPQLIIDPATTAYNGNYVVTVSADGCTSTSTAFILGVFESPTVSIDALTPINCTDGNQTVNLNATAIGGTGVYTYAWTGPNGFVSADEDPILNNVTSVNAGNYNLIATDSNGCETSMVSSNLVITNGPEQPIIQSTGVSCEGGATDLSIEAYSGSSVTYEWTKNGATIASNTNELSFNPISLDDIGEYVVTVNVDGCIVTSNAFDLNVYENPLATINTIAPFACTNGNEDLTLSAIITGGSAPFAYTWTGPNGFSSSAISPTINNITAVNAGTYTLSITDNNNCLAQSSSIEVEIVNAIDEPMITSTGPACEGDEVVLSVQSFSGASVSYVWTKDGNIINNNTAQLILDPVQSEDAGVYAVTVSVGDCSDISAPYTVEVYSKPNASIDPIAPITCTDGNQSLVINATITNATAPITYEWTGPNGFTSASEDPTLVGLNFEQSGTYTLVVTDANGCPTAPVSVAIQISDAVDQPVIMSSGSACEGEEITMTVAPVSGANIDYNWSLNGLPINLNSNELVINPATTADAGIYQVEVSADGCSGTSAEYLQTIFAEPTATIDAIAPIECTDGTQPLTLNANPMAGSGNYQFAWIGPNGFISTLEDPTLTNINSSNAGNYTLVVSDDNGCMAEAVTLELSITDGLSQPVISGSGAVCEGESVILEIAPYSGSNVAYTWTRDGTPLPNNSNVLELTPINTADIGNYEVTVSVDGCLASASPYFLDVFDTPSASIETIEPLTCTNGLQSLTLNSTLQGGSGDYTYEWTGPNGFTSNLADPVLSNVDATTSGSYILNVTDLNGCSAQTETVQVLVTMQPEQPIIATTGVTCEGGALTLGVNQYAGSMVTYSWIKDGAPLTITGNEFTINPVSIQDAGAYQLQLEVDGCLALSDVLLVEIFENPSVTINEVSAFECTDGQQDLILDANITGGSGDYSYEWIGPNGFNSTLANPILSNLNATQAGNYALQIIDSNGCESNIASIQVVITDALTQPNIATSGPACEGATVAIEIPMYTGANVDYRWFKDGVELTINSNQLIFNPVMNTDAGDYSVIVEVDGCSAQAEPISVVVYEGPAVNIGDIPAIECTDGSLDLILDATVQGGTLDYSFAWQGVGGFFATSEDAQLQNITSANSGTYTMQVTDANGCQSNLEAINITITDALEQPIISSNSPVCKGENIEMSIPAYSGNSVVYNWTKDGQSININSNVLYLTPAQLADNGDYQVEVVANGCNTTTPVHTITVFDRPEIDFSNIPEQLCTDGDDELVMDANISGGVGPFTYEWTGPNDFFSVNEDPVLVNINGGMSGSYTLYVTDANGCQANPNTIEIDITDDIVEPIITSNAPVCVGEVLTIQTQVYTGIEISYEWRRNGMVLPNQNNYEIIVDPATLDWEGTYEVTVFIDGCQNVSDTYELDLYEQPIVIIDPIDALLCTDGLQEVNFSASVAGGLADYDYEWTGPNGFTSNMLNPVLTNVDESKAGIYSLVATDFNGCVSDPSEVVLDVQETLEMPLITSSGQTCEGELITLSVQNYNDTDVDIIWSTPNNTSENITGLNTNELIINPANAAVHNGIYTVTVSVNGCSATSDVLNMIVFEQPVASIDAVTPLLCTDGLQEVTFTSTVIGGVADYDYLWSGPADFISNEANPTVTNVDESNAGTYTLIVTDANGCVADAANVVLDVANSLAMPIVATSGPACNGEAIVLSVQEYSGTNVEYTWSTPNGTTVSMTGLNSNILTINPVDETAHEGAYSLTVSVDGCAVSSNELIVAIFDAPIASPTATTEVICHDGDLQLTANAQGTNSLEYQWIGPNGFSSELENPILTNVSILNNGEYELTVTSISGCAITTSLEVSNILPQVDQPTIISNSPICEGEDLILISSAAGDKFEWIGPMGASQSTLQIPGLTTLSGTTVLSAASLPYLSGAWTVRVTDPNGCVTENAVAIDVVINEIPVAIATNGGSICAGEEAQLFANEIEGATYQWYEAGSANVISSLQSPTLTNLTETTDYELVVVLDGCESGIATTTINVSAAPLANPTFNYTLNVDCSPNDLILMANATGEDLVYAWTGPNGFTSQIANPAITNVTAAANGIYELVVTDIFGCSATYATDIVNIIENQIPQPIIAHDGAACQGDEVTLSVPQYQGSDVEYVWTTYGNNISGVNTNEIIISPASQANEGDYQVEVTIDGCTLLSDVYTFNVYEQPTANPMHFLDDVCEGGTLELYAMAGNIDGNETYDWTGPNGFTAQGPNQLISAVTVADNGTYTVTVTSQSGCSIEASIVLAEIIAQPETPTIIAPEAVCENDFITLSLSQVYGSDVEINWYNAQGVTIAQGAIVSFPANAPFAISPFFAALEHEGCFSDLSVPVIVDVNELPLANANNNGPLCHGEMVQLYAGTIAGASYEWRIAGENAIISIEQNPEILNVNMTTTYELTVFSDGCANATSALTTVVINPTPIVVDLTQDLEVCEGEDVLLSGQLSDDIEGLMTMTWLGPNLNYTNQVDVSEFFDLELTNISTDEDGTYTLQIENEEGCLSPLYTVNVTVDPSPQTPVITAVEDDLCQGQDLVLNAPTYNGNDVMYNWYFEGVIQSTTVTPTYIIENVTVANEGNYTLEVSVDGCVSNISNIVIVEVFGTATPPVAINSTSAGNAACEGDIVSLEVPFFENTTYEWFGPNGFNETGFNVIIPNATVDNAGNYFCVVTLNDCATVISTTTTVYINIAPNAPTISNDGPYCEGEDVNIFVTSPLNPQPGDVQTFDWYYTATNAFIASTATDTLSLLSATANQSGEYYVIFSINGCEAIEQSVSTHVEITALPVQEANAGSDVEICAATSTSLNAIAPLLGTGEWTSPTGATITNSEDPETEVFDLLVGENMFIWTLSVGACEAYDADTVVIDLAFIPIDEANAGIDQFICGTSNATLNATSTTTAIGLWSQSSEQASQGVVINDPANPFTTVSGMEQGLEYIFTWSLSEDTCDDYDVDEVMITISDLPVVNAYIINDLINLCGDEAVTITAETPSVGEGIWTTNGNALIVEPNNPETLVADLDSGSNVFYWTLSNGACENYSFDSLVIINEDQLIATDDQFNIDFNESLEEADFLANDFFGNVTDWTFTITEKPSKGQVIVTSELGIFNYTPVTNFFGTDSLQYTICNVNCPDQCDTATVYFFVNGMNGDDCFIPNLITPNNDEMNDCLKFPCLVGYPDNSIMIFNRWGDKVYQAAPYNNDWGGTYRTRELPAGTYYFILQLEPGAVPIQHFFTVVR